MKTSRGIDEIRKEGRASINLKSSLHDLRSNRSSYSSSTQGSFIKENIRDAQKLLQEVSVAIPELSKNKATPTADKPVSESFQNQLKDLSKLLAERQNLQGNEDTNLKRIKNLRSGKSMSNMEKLIENKENTENINPNTNVLDAKITHVRERNLKQKMMAKPDSILEINLGLDSNNKVLPSANKSAAPTAKIAEAIEKNPRILNTLKQSESFLRLQQFENRVSQLKSPTHTQPIKAFDFSSPRVNNETQPKEAVVIVQKIDVVENSEPKKEEIKAPVEEIKALVEETQNISTPQTEKQEFEISMTSRVFNPTLRRKTESKEEKNESTPSSTDRTHQTPEEKDTAKSQNENLVTSSLSLKQSTHETVNSSEKPIEMENTPINLDKQIQNIFLQSSKEKQVSPFKVEPEPQATTTVISTD